LFVISMISKRREPLPSGSAILHPSLPAAAPAAFVPEQLAVLLPFDCHVYRYAESAVRFTATSGDRNSCQHGKPTLRRRWHMCQ
jgi:hypothetical protein